MEPKTNLQQLIEDSRAKGETSSDFTARILARNDKVPSIVYSTVRSLTEVSAEEAKATADFILALCDWRMQEVLDLRRLQEIRLAELQEAHHAAA